MGRKEKKYHFIYKTTNLLSGRYYIGMHSTDDLEDGYLGSGDRLRKAIRKHGKENFIREILEFCESREELKLREGEVVNLEEIAKEDCMNLKVGGEGGWPESAYEGWRKKLKDKKFREKYCKEKSRQNKKLWENETLRAIMIKNIDWRGRKHSEETKKKMSESKKGRGVGNENSQYGTCWITKNGENRKIKKEELETYLSQGWERGRKF